MTTNTTPDCMTPAPFGAVLRPGALTGPALQALGLIRYADDPGAQGAAGQDPAQQTTQQGQDGTGAPAGTPTPRDLQQAQQRAASGQDDEQQQKGKPLGDLDPAVQKELDRARSDAARYRTEKDAEVQRVQQEADARIKAVLKAAGYDPDGSDDPEKVAQQAAEAREQAQQEAKEARLELALYRAAADPAVHADPIALLDSRRFMERARSIDPSDTDALTAAIRETIQENPKLAATQAAARSSADFTGGSGEGAITAEKFKAMSNAAKNDLFKSDPQLFRSLAGA